MIVLDGGVSKLPLGGLEERCCEGVCRISQYHIPADSFD